MKKLLLVLSLLLCCCEPLLNSGIVIRKEFEPERRWTTTEFQTLTIEENTFYIPYVEHHYTPPYWYITIEGQVYIEKEDKWKKKQRRVSVAKNLYDDLHIGDNFMVDLVE